MRNKVPRSRHFSLEELGDGVYAAIATDEGWAVGNAGVVSLGDHTVVFDTLSSHVAAADLKAAAEAATGGKVDYVVLSHGHRDHYRGNQVFGEATIVASRAVCELLILRRAEREAKIKGEGLGSIRNLIQEEFEAWKSNPATTGKDKILWNSYEQSLLQGLESYDFRLPDVGFEDKMMFYGSERTAEAVACGGGHSRSDSLLYLPEEGIAFLGDLLFIGYHPYLADGNPEELLRILDRVEALEPKVLVPGHGPVGTSRDIQPMRDCVLALLKLAKEERPSARATGANLKPIPTPFDTLKWGAFWNENLEFLQKRESAPAVK